jgi:hypothetical protein
MTDEIVIRTTMFRDSQGHYPKLLTIKRIPVGMTLATGTGLLYILSCELCQRIVVTEEGDRALEDPTSQAR